MKKIITIALLFPLFSFAQWTEVSTVNTNFVETSFISPKIGYGLNSYYDNLNKPRFKLFKTTDAGYNWQIIYTSAGYALSIDAFKDSAWIIRYYDDPVTSHYIMKSKNDGDSVEKIFQIKNEGDLYTVDSTLIRRDSTVYSDTVIYHNVYQYEMGNKLSDIKPLNIDTILIYKNNGYFFETTNGGLSWDSTKINGKFYKGVSLIVHSFRHYWLWDHQSTFYKTTNGKDWNSFSETGLNITPNRNIQFSFSNPRIGYALPKDGFKVYKTTDSAKTWKLIKEFIPASDPNLYFIDLLGFYDCNAGFISYGEWSPYPTLRLFTTLDGGLTLNEQRLPDHLRNTGSTGTHFIDIVYTDINNITLIASSNDFTLIAKTNNGGDKVVKTLSGECLNIFSTTEINQAVETSKFRYWPNPANDELTISTSSSGETKLIIRELSGKVITTKKLLLNSDQTIINISDLKPGIYFATIITGTAVENFKFIKE